jgi:hypothetical protein
LAPDLGDGELANQLAAATFPLPRLLVWLDELQRFLDGPNLTPGQPRSPRPRFAGCWTHLPPW